MHAWIGQVVLLNTCEEGIFPIMPQDHFYQCQLEETGKNQQQELENEVQDDYQTDDEAWSHAATKGSQDDDSVKDDRADNNPSETADLVVRDVSTLLFSIRRWLDQVPSEEPWNALRQLPTKSDTDSVPSGSSVG